MVKISDRLISAISYFTYGFFGIIWIIYANVAKKSISSFVMYNLYQACFISVILALFAFAFNIIIKFFGAFGFLGDLIRSFNLFVNGTPIYLGFSISGLIVTALIIYMVVFALLGKRPFVPFVSPIIYSLVGD